jgi:glycosyltransferase involved in cell wall biosynthesis
MNYFVSRTVSFFEEGEWSDEVSVHDEHRYINKITAKAPKILVAAALRWAPLKFAFRVLKESRKYDAFVLGRYGYWFPVIYRGRKPIILFDTEFRSAPGIIDRAACSRAAAVIFNTHEEARRAATYMKLPLEKFRVVPMPYQSSDVWPSEDGDYVFAGGRQGRDWATLLKAVEGLPYKVRIYTSNKLAEDLPRNVSIHWVSRREFYEAGARSACVVVPLLAEPFRITGTTTFISSMACGKPVIVTEPFGAPDYMAQGVSGFYCDYGDWRSVRDYIVKLMEDKQLRLSVGAAAKRESERFSPAQYRKSILTIVEEFTRPARS